MEQPLLLLVRIAIATALGGVIGYERDLHGRPAGLRTHMIVALASSTFMVISLQFVYLQHYAVGGLVEVDASRIAASIVTGIGFLAGGAIMRTGLNVQGLTTAAALWLVGAIGMAAGAGMFLTAVFVTVLGVAALTLLRRFEDKDDRHVRRRATLDLNGDATIAAIAERLAAIGVRASTVSYVRRPIEHTMTVTLELRVPRDLSEERVVEELERGDVRQLTVEAAP